jgi:chromosome segregation ATPase
MVEKWKKEAKKSKMTTSSFIQNIINSYFENGYMGKNKNTMEKQIQELNQTIKQLRSDNIELNKKVNMLDSLTDRYEEEINNLKNKPYINGSFEGIREFNSKMIDLLKEKRNIKELELLDLLHIKHNDFDSIKAMNRQLDVLFEYNLVKKYKGGIQWMG